MAVYLGVDLHVSKETVCWCDTAEGEIRERTLDHRVEDVGRFYAQFGAGAVIGVESSGYSLWFQQMVEGLGMELRVGDAYAIRQMARRRQKNDRRDAALLLDLLLRGDFPAVHVPCAASREVLSLLRYRHRLVGMRTMLKNGLQAVALNHRLRLGSRLFTAAGLQRLQKLPLAGSYARQREHSLGLLAALSERVAAVERDLLAAGEEERVKRLRTHPGVGLLTSLAVVHALEPASRFRRSKQVTAYCGLDPQEHSSGECQRYGHISKQGSRLLRFLLLEAAHNSIRQDPDLRRFYYHLLAKKNSAIAAVAVARKLVLRLYRMLREGIDYQEFRRRGREAGRARDDASSATEAELSI